MESNRITINDKGRQLWDRIEQEWYKIEDVKLEHDTFNLKVDIARGDKNGLSLIKKTITAEGKEKETDSVPRYLWDIVTEPQLPQKPRKKETKVLEGTAKIFRIGIIHFSPREGQEIKLTESLLNKEGYVSVFAKMEFEI